jgi:hypothetical protein
VGGVDVPPYPYGKWINNPVDPTVTADYTNGTPPTGGTNIYGVGSMCLLSLPVARGQPHVCDIIRYGRAEARFTGGETANYATFGGFNTLNDAQTARWGLIQKTDGGYLWKGLMKIGLSTITTTNRARTTNVVTLTTSGAHGLKVGDTVVIAGVGGTGYNGTVVILSIPTTTTFTYNNGTFSNEGSTADTGGTINGVADFRDSNQTIFIQDTRKVTSTFNKVEIRNASTRVDWTGINFTCLSPSTTASKGDFAMIDAADVNIDSCTFNDMNTFVFLSSGSVAGTTFRRCSTITSGGAVFSGSTIINSTAAVSVTASSPSDIEDFTGCSFISDGTNHAMDLGTVSATVSYSWANYLTGYAGTDGSTGNEAIKVNVASGQTLTISVTSGYNTPSIYNTGTGTVTVVTGTRTVKVAVTSVSGAVSGANVFLAATGSGPFPVNATINSITRSTTTATVTHAAVHGLATSDQVNITGITDKVEDNGVHTITVTGTTTYTYTTTNSGSTNYTGTKKATFVFLKGVADSPGGTGNEISMTRSISADQPVIGWARKSTSAPYYKEGAISGTVSSSGNTTFSPVLISDD